MKKKELNLHKSKTAKELQKKVEELKIEIVKSTAEIKAGREKNLKKAKMLKQDLAQLLTLLNSKKIAENLGKEGEDK